MSAPRRKRFYPYFFDFKFYMVTGSHWGYLPCGGRLRFMVLLILFYGFARQNFLIGRGYGALGFSSVLCIYGCSIKAA